MPEEKDHSEYYIDFGDVPVEIVIEQLEKIKRDIHDISVDPLPTAD